MKYNNRCLQDFGFAGEIMSLLWGLWGSWEPDPGDF